MRIDLADDRGRLSVSIGAAVVVHIIILLIAGLRASEQPFEPEYGPVTVRISLAEQEPRRTEAEPVESFVAEDVPASETVEDAPVDTPAEPLPAAETAEVKTPAPVPVSAPAAPEPAAAEPDYDVIAAVRERTGGSSGGVDARSVFGDDPVPATTDSSSSAAASFFTSDGSEVVPGEASVETRPDRTAAEVSEPDRPLVDSDTYTALDDKIKTAAVTGGGSTGTDGTERAADEKSGTSEGNSPLVSFKDASVSRELLQWTAPVIPEEVRKAGLPEYTVIIELEIDSDGFISRADFIRRSGNTDVDAAVQTALRSWGFEESTDGVKKVKATLTYVIKIQ